MSSPIADPSPVLERPPVGSSQVVVASLRRRLGAYLIDAVIAAFASIPLLIVAIVIASTVSGGSFDVSGRLNADSTSTDLLNFALVAALFSVTPFVLVGLLPMRSGAGRGRTIGKRVLDLQIIGADGQPLRPAAAFLRAAVFFGLSLGGLIVGALLDTVAGTPPLFTYLFVAASTAFLLADVVIAPSRGEVRRTLHDRFSGTVVVDCRTAPPFDPTAEPAPALPAGRPKTGATLVGLGLIGAMLSIAIVLSLVTAIVGSSRSTSSSDDAATFGRVGPPSDSNSDSDANSGASVTPGTGALTIDEPPYFASQLLVTDRTPVRDVQRTAMRLSAAFFHCFEVRKSDSKCDSASKLGLPSDVTIEQMDDLRYGAPDWAGKIILTESEVSGAARAIIGVYAADGTLWASGTSEKFRIVPFCLGPRGTDCSSTKAAAPYLRGTAVAQEIVDAAEGRG